MNSARAKVPLLNGGVSKTPIGPFQTIVLQFLSAASKALTDCEPMSRICVSMGTLSIGTCRASPRLSRSGGYNRVNRKENFDPSFVRRLKELGGGFDIIVFNQGFADFLPLCLKEGIRHRAADDEVIDFRNEVFEQPQLGRYFRASDHDCEWPLRVVQGLFEILDLFLELISGGTFGHKAGNSFNGGVSAVQAAKASFM